MSQPTEGNAENFVKKKKKIPIVSKSNEYLTPEEYSKHVKKHKVTIYRWLNSGKIEGAIKLGRCWRIPVIVSQQTEKAH